MRRSPYPSALRRMAAPAVLLSLLALLLLVASSSPSPVLSVTAAPSTASVSASINSAYLAYFRQALLAYQLVAPSFSAVTLTSNSGEGGRTAAASGNFDFTVATAATTATMRALYPNLVAFPIATIGIMPVYNLPTATVGSATLQLTNQAMCRIWRANITHWSAATPARGQDAHAAAAAVAKAVSVQGADCVLLSSWLA